MTGLAALLAAPPEVRAAALSLLDEMSEPLSPRLLERTLQNGGLTRKAARQAMRALRQVELIALVPR